MLIRDFDTLQKYAKIGTINYVYAKPTLRTVEETFIIPILGRGMYNSLDLALTAQTDEYPLPETYDDLLDFCYSAIGPLFCYLHADKADVAFSDAGMQRQESNTNKVAYQEQRTKFKEANLLEGEKSLELLIQYLEEHMQNYEDWTNSDTFKNYRSLFIKTGSEFQELFPSATPYRNYWCMRSRMQDVQEHNIRKFLGDELYEELRDELQELEPDLVDEEKELLFKLKKAIANFTVAFSVPVLNVRIDSNGLTIPAEFSTGTNDNDNKRAGISDKQYTSFITNCTDSGRNWLDNAHAYLLKNKAAFPSWIGFATTNNCDEYESSNDHESGAFGFI